MTTLHLQHVALKFSDTNRETNEDVGAAFERGAVAVGFTEAARGRKRNNVMSVAKHHGYEVYGGRGDTCIAVTRAVEVVGHDSLLVNTAQGGGVAQGGHSARTLDSVIFEFAGAEVTVFEAHWLRLTAHGIREHKMMTDAAIEGVQRRGRGRDLAFLMGDVNWQDGPGTGGGDRRKPGYLFAQGGLTTVWDESGIYRDTHGNNTIDTIASYDRDGRVSLKRTKVWHGVHSDHGPVSAWFDIKEKR